MSTTAVSSSSIYQELQAYFQQRTTDVQQLGQDLTAGNLANAQQDFSTLETLGQGGPYANGDVFQSSQREQDLNAVGQALQSGNLSAAQQAFAQLESTYSHHQPQQVTSPPAQEPTPASTDAAPAAQTTSPPTQESIYQQLQAFYQQRGTDVQQLGQDLAAGNITNALADFNNLQSLGQGGPFKSGGAFNNKQREQDLTTIGQALQSGNLSAAQQAFAQLEATYGKHQGATSPPVYAFPSGGGTTAVPILSSTGTTSAAPAGPEIVLNLANAPAGEQITVNFASQSNGTEQVNISAANPQNQTPEQISLNVNPNTNQQVVLNLFGNSGGNSGQGSTVNTTA